MSLNGDLIDLLTKDIDKDLKNIDKAMEYFLDDMDIEKYLVRLPDILLKTF
ncbi:MAG: hypothetical protein PHF46_02995 [Candidatus Gracilibacteria bacterium]|nr:hypothetical protein [Candidatus Gracilibacteria bacterium]MDD3120350.1 hypothetical protein [Candidatus Gracilibacteria bacterium]MDD4530352.1 hypothetical protein [Candidatus Gracilibacteria bacterium]